MVRIFRGLNFQSEKMLCKDLLFLNHEFATHETFQSQLRLLVNDMTDTRFYSHDGRLSRQIKQKPGGVTVVVTWKSSEAYQQGESYLALLISMPLIGLCRRSRCFTHRRGQNQAEFLQLCEKWDASPYNTQQHELRRLLKARNKKDLDWLPFFQLSQS